MYFYMEQHYIDEGQRGRCSVCPVALMLNNNLLNRSALVFPEQTRIYDGVIEESIIVWNSLEVIDFIIHFDDYIYVGPQWLSLNIDPYTVKRASVLKSIIYMKEQLMNQMVGPPIIEKN